MKWVCTLKGPLIIVLWLASGCVECDPAAKLQIHMALLYAYLIRGSLGLIELIPHSTTITSTLAAL